MTRSSEDLDRLIGEALEAEHREILREFREEPGFFAQAYALFGGKLGWVMWLAYIVNVAGALVAAWAAWMMLQTDDPVMTVRWAVLILAAMSVGLFMKNSIGQQSQTNRVLREVKRLELQILRDKARSGC